MGHPGNKLQISYLYFLVRLNPKDGKTIRLDSDREQWGMWAELDLNTGGLAPESTHLVSTLFWEYRIGVLRSTTWAHRMNMRLSESLPPKQSLGFHVHGMFSVDTSIGRGHRNAR